MTDRKTSAPWLIAAVLLVLIGGYVGAYYAMVERYEYHWGHEGAFAHLAVYPRAHGDADLPPSAVVSISVAAVSQVTAGRQQCRRPVRLEPRAGLVLSGREPDILNRVVRLPPDITAPISWR